MGDFSPIFASSYLYEGLNILIIARVKCYTRVQYKAQFWLHDKDKKLSAMMNIIPHLKIDRSPLTRIS